MRATGSCETPKARDQANIGLGVSYTLGLKSSWQPVCHGTRAHPRDVMKGQPDAPLTFPSCQTEKKGGAYHGRVRTMKRSLWLRLQNNSPRQHEEAGQDRETNREKQGEAQGRQGTNGKHSTTLHNKLSRTQKKRIFKRAHTRKRFGI